MDNVSRFSPRLALMALALSLSACVATKAYAAEPFAFPTIVNEPDPGDISNGFYPALRKVGYDDGELRAKLEWLVQAGAPNPVRIKSEGASCVQLSPCTPNAGSFMPAGIWFAKNGRELQLDLTLVFNFPSTALTDLETFYSFGNTAIRKVYVGPVIPVKIVLLTPVGEAWPDKCPDLCFRAAAGDNYPYDFIYTDASGQYVKERTFWAFFPTGALWRKTKK